MFVLCCSLGAVLQSLSVATCWRWLRLPHAAPPLLGYIVLRSATQDQERSPVHLFPSERQPPRCLVFGHIPLFYWAAAGGKLLVGPRRLAFDDCRDGGRLDKDRER